MLLLGSEVYMIGVYDLYDMHLLLVAIRQYPSEPINERIIFNMINVLQNKAMDCDTNQFRKAIRSIESLEQKNIYDFVFVDNVYSYFSLTFLKNEYIYTLLTVALNELLEAVKMKNYERVVDLSDCLHNLPIVLVENEYSLPLKFWKTYLNYYRKKWNSNFLRMEQKNQFMRKCCFGRLNNK